MGIGKILLKCFPIYIYIVDDCAYMFPMRCMESVGYHGSFIMAKSLAWSMKPKAFLKSI